MASEALLHALMVTAELTGTEISDIAARVMRDDLEVYPEPQLIEALRRCRRELKGRLTIADIVSRLDDGRPGPEEAWAMLPKTDRESVVWCDEMAHAFGVCNPLLQEGDTIAARMAFKEAYLRALQSSRDAGLAPQWTLSQGYDKSGRAAAVREAAERGRIPQSRALTMLAMIAPEYADEHRRALSGPQPVAALLPNLE